VLGTLHHHLKVFVDLVVLGFGARRERVVGGVDVLAGTVRTAAAVFVFFLVQRLDDVLIGERFVGFVVLGVLEQHFVHVGRRVLVEFVRTAEDDQGDLAVAQHRQLVRLLHHAEFALVERHLSIALVGNARDLNLLAAHGVRITEVLLPAAAATTADSND